MSAPLASGLAGILRSINPLVLPGEGVLDRPYRGIRSVLIESSMLPTFPNTWDPRLGYGKIRADSAGRCRPHYLFDDGFQSLL